VFLTATKRFQASHFRSNPSPSDNGRGTFVMFPASSWVTAFIGYECTSNTGGNNLHRNVIFRDSADKASQVEPYTTVKPLGSDNPADYIVVVRLG
jgi:hypothetical protein